MTKDFFTDSFNKKGIKPNGFIPFCISMVVV